MRLAQIIARLAELKKENDNPETTAERLAEIQREITNLLAEKAEIEASQRDGLTGNNADPSKEGLNSRDTVAAERQRVSDILTLCREFDMDPNSYIKDGKPVDEVRAAILDELKKKNKPAEGVGTDVSVTKDAMDKFRAAATDAILLRGGIKIDKPADGAQELRSASLIDLARECLHIAGKHEEARKVDKVELLRAALTPDTQYSGILDNSVNKSMQTAYTAQNTTYELWTSRGSNPDFKPVNRYQISEAGDLLKINQNGEFVDDKMSDEVVTSQLVTYGRKFSLTRQAIINDDLSYITKMPQAYARAAKRGINKAVYAILNSNPTVYDGYTLFHTTVHKNWIASDGAAPSVSELDKTQQLMIKQKNLRGLEALNIRPRFVIVPVELDIKTRQLLYSVNDPSTSVNPNTVNPFNGRLEVISDAELSSATAWFIAADPSQIDTIEVTYLNGMDMPTLENKVSFDILGIEYRIYIDYGITVIDYRGLAKNNGTA